MDYSPHLFIETLRGFFADLDLKGMVRVLSSFF